MRIMAIDYGDRRIGLAVSDETGSICGDAWTISEWDFNNAAQRIAEEASGRGVVRFVLGLPKNMDGSLGPRAQKSAEFAGLLGSLSGLEVILWDERLTTVDASRILIENGRRGKKRKQKLDTVAAALILESYLDSLAK